MREFQNIIFNLALYDLAFKRIDLKLKVKDESGGRHEILFSRLKTTGIMIDINRTSKDVTVYDFVDVVFKKMDTLPQYLKEAVWKAEEVQKTL